MPDFWSLISGLASILSLFIALADKFASWKKYTMPLAALLGGIALGRLTASHNEPSYIPATQTTTIIVLFVAMIGFLSYKFISKKEYAWGYSLMLMGLITGLPALTSAFHQPDTAIAFDDVFEIASFKEREGELTKAERYYRVASTLAANFDTRVAMVVRANELQQKRTQIILLKPITPPQPQ